jgi:GH24 family phage-related lysozyme (muramidase)
MATNKGGKVGLAVALATAIAIPAEGLRRIAYYDPPGILTVCYGSTSGVIAGKRYTMDECKARLDRDMLHAVEQVDRCAPNVPPNVLAAFGDAAYNLGPRIACDTAASTAARKLKAQDWPGACRELPKWDKARIGGVLVPLPGLTKRRAKEMALCLSS